MHLEKLVLGVFWLLTLMKQLFSPSRSQSAILIREYRVMKNSLTLKMKGKEGAKTLPTLRKRSVWKQKRKRRKRKRKVRLEALPAAWNFAWCVLSYRSTMSFFFLSFSFPEEKEEEKAKEEKPEPKGWALCLLAWQLTGCLCTSLCILPMGYCVTCGVGREMWQLGWLCHGEKFA